MKSSQKLWNIKKCRIPCEGKEDNSELQTIYCGSKLKKHHVYFVQSLIKKFVKKIENFACMIVKHHVY